MSVESLKAIEGINVEQGLVNCMDDEGLYLSIIGMYVEQINEYLPILTTHYDNKAWDEYGKLAHSVKGASASVGTFVVQELSAELEQAGKQDDANVITSKHDQYVNLLNSTLEQLQGCL